MDYESNPYSPPQSTELATSTLLAGETVVTTQRRLAIAIFIFTVGMACVFVVLDSNVIRSRLGPWPMIYGTAILSILSSFITRDRVYAPLTCFGAIMISASLVAVANGLQFAQLHLALMIAAAFSVPSLLIARWRSSSAYAKL